MAIATGFHDHPPLPLSRTPRRAALFLHSPAAAAAAAARACATATPPRVAAARKRDDDDGAITDGPEPRRKSPLLDLAPLLAAAAAAAAAAAGPRAELAASGGSMGGSSDDSSDSSSSSCDSSSDDSWWSSSPSEEGKEATYHESVSTAPVELSPAAKRRQGLIFWGGVALASAAAAALVKAALHHAPPRTTVVKLQVALRGVAAAKSFQKDLNEIAEKVQASNQRWYKFILTETIRSLCRHKDSCISSSLSADVKDYWKEHFNKISIEERSKFDPETFSNLDGIKRKRSYCKKTDGSKNEYIVLTILIAAEGELKFPSVIRSSTDLEAVVGKLNYVPAGEIRGIHVLWTPQQENDVLSEKELKEDYPYLKPLRDD
ncbi:unnamed protein product [Urochloa humidicola]